MNAIKQEQVPNSTAFYAIFWSRKDDPTVCGNGKPSGDLQVLEIACQKANLEHLGLLYEVHEVPRPEDWQLSLTENLNEALKIFSLTQKTFKDSKSLDETSRRAAYQAFNAATRSLTELIVEANKIGCFVLFKAELYGKSVQGRIGTFGFVSMDSMLFYAQEADAEYTFSGVSIGCIQSFDLEVEPIANAETTSGKM